MAAESRVTIAMIVVFLMNVTYCTTRTKGKIKVKSFVLNRAKVLSQYRFMILRMLTRRFAAHGKAQGSISALG